MKTLIRSHEPCECVEVRQGGKILTLFSRKGAPYFNKQAAYLLLDGAMLREAKDANDLAKCVPNLPYSLKRYLPFAEGTAARIW